MAEYGDARIPDRIWAKLYPEPNTGCWLWAGKTTHDGYGRVWFGRDTLVHVVVYDGLVGPPESGMHRDHLCRVRCCANPDHIEPVAQYVNTMRGNGFAAINSRKTACPRGHGYTQRRDRICKRCEAAASARYLARRRAAATEGTSP